MAEAKEEGEVLRVSGDLTFATVAGLARQSSGWNPRVSAIDLAAVGECDSAGLALLLEWRRRARREGIDVVYRNVPPRLLQLARISELDTFLA
ncbi:MAG TPA: STAS domain-containing protein [Gammaproteobacteria bacterium]|nr:STAS domain-containing protein [Gammaproteobacteria bacterium]